MAYLLEATARRKGDELAVIDEFASLTWTALNERVNKVMNLFKALALQPGDTISLMSGNRNEYFEIAAAALHAGLIIVPVNWHWTDKELAYVLDDSDSRALFVEDKFAEVAARAFSDPKTSRCSARVVLGSAEVEGFVSYNAALVDLSDDEPDEAKRGAVMFYTSGTTGFPKGVRSSRWADEGHVSEFGALGAAVSAVLGIPHDGVTLLDGPAYHSAQFGLSVYPLLAIGSSVVMRQKFDAASMLTLIDQHQVTNVHLVPTQFVRLLKLSDEQKNAFSGSSLVTIPHGAAPCSPTVKRQMMEWWGPILTEYYGATESGFLTVATGQEWLDHPGTVGKATRANEILVLNDEGESCPTGEVGTICWRNLTGADFKYHKAEGKTESAHLAPGIGTVGDVGYLDGDGFLYLSDRKIDMIISGGVNIYPAEIEGVLITHPSVADAAVFGIPDEEMGEQVKAAIELVGGVTPSDTLAQELIAFVRENLAGYKAPKSIDFEQTLPRHPTGKLYKRLLRDKYWDNAGRSI